MDNLKDFWNDYKGAIIGVIIVILLLATKAYKVIFVVTVLIAGAFAGNYIQQNKESVKEKIKNFIDRM